MNWDLVFTSGIVPGIVGAVSGAVFGGIVSYIVARRIQVLEHKREDSREAQRRAEEEAQWRKLITLNSTQKEVLEFCREHPSERYKLEYIANGYLLISDDQQKKSFNTIVRNEVADMQTKGYLRIISNNERSLYIFELTNQGKTLEI